MNNLGRRRPTGGAAGDPTPRLGAHIFYKERWHNLQGAMAQPPQEVNTLLGYCGVPMVETRIVADAEHAELAARDIAAPRRAEGHRAGPRSAPWWRAAPAARWSSYSTTSPSV